MDKRYQVFVSSTYADLKQERQRVIQALMEMDCIPAGMELFPASDEEQWQFIRRIIDDCDYYLLIIGGRYGSIDETGISYTEREFDYAVEKGMKVVALLHGEPEKLPLEKSEGDPAARAKLVGFVEKVKTNRLVKFWKSTDELPGMVALSLMKTIKMYPAVGWVRPSSVPSNDLLLEINALRKENAELQARNSAAAQAKPEVENLADLDSKNFVMGKSLLGNARISWKGEISWRRIFALISPYLMKDVDEAKLQKLMADHLGPEVGARGTPESIDEQIYQTIILQFKALGYVQSENLGSRLSWTLTPRGEQQMMQERTKKKVQLNPPEPPAAPGDSAHNSQPSPPSE